MRTKTNKSGMFVFVVVGCGGGVFSESVFDVALAYEMSLVTGVALFGLSQAEQPLYEAVCSSPQFAHFGFVFSLGHGHSSNRWEPAHRTHLSEAVHLLWPWPKRWHRKHCPAKCLCFCGSTVILTSTTWSSWYIDFSSRGSVTKTSGMGVLLLRRVRRTTLSGWKPAINRSSLMDSASIGSGTPRSITWSNFSDFSIYV